MSTIWNDSLKLPSNIYFNGIKYFYRAWHILFNWEQFFTSCNFLVTLFSHHYLDFNLFTEFSVDLHRNWSNFCTFQVKQHASGLKTTMRKYVFSTHILFSIRDSVMLNLHNLLYFWLILKRWIYANLFTYLPYDIYLFILLICLFIYDVEIYNIFEEPREVWNYFMDKTWYVFRGPLGCREQRVVLTNISGNISQKLPASCKVAEFSKVSLSETCGGKFLDVKLGFLQNHFYYFHNQLIRFKCGLSNILSLPFEKFIDLNVSYERMLFFCHSPYPLISWHDNLEVGIKNTIGNLLMW